MYDIKILSTLNVICWWDSIFRSSDSGKRQLLWAAAFAAVGSCSNGVWEGRIRGDGSEDPGRENDNLLKRWAQHQQEESHWHAAAEGGATGEALITPRPWRYPRSSIRVCCLRPRIPTSPHCLPPAHVRYFST